MTAGQTFSHLVISLPTNLQKGLVTVATIAVVVLAIMVISGGRNWVDKLKSIGGGILVGIAIGCYGVGIVAGMFA